MILVVCALHAELRGWRPRDGVEVLEAGVGVVEAAAGTASAVTRTPYAAVVNAGIAGAFRGRARVAEAVIVAEERIADFGREDGGRLALPDDVWLTVSPKERLHDAMAERADEAKLIVDGRVPYEWMDRFGSRTRIFLQPEGNKPANVALAYQAVKARPSRLRLSLQTHKFIGVP